LGQFRDMNPKTAVTGTFLHFVLHGDGRGLVVLNNVQNRIFKKSANKYLNKYIHKYIHMSTIVDDPQFTSYRGGGRRVQIANSFGVLRQSRQFMKMCRKHAQRSLQAVVGGGGSNRKDKKGKRCVLINNSRCSRRCSRRRTC
jgi:hypothetical protein